ncbi:MAG: hypothetical protein HY392_00830 [Candidatus Diapherotrites archaeon]|nr:hypothetical protein [Candidatus Diapherotrites archaeon]
MAILRRKFPRKASKLTRLARASAIKFAIDFYKPELPPDKQPKSTVTATQARRRQISRELNALKKNKRMNRFRLHENRRYGNSAEMVISALMPIAKDRSGRVRAAMRKRKNLAIEIRERPKVNYPAPRARGIWTHPQKSINFI